MKAKLFILGLLAIVAMSFTTASGEKDAKEKYEIKMAQLHQVVAARIEAIQKLKAKSDFAIAEKKAFQLVNVSFECGNPFIAIGNGYSYICRYCYVMEPAAYGWYECEPGYPLPW